MNIRPSTEAERKYAYKPSMEIQGKTRCIGHLRGDFDRDGNGFFTSWDEYCKQWKTDGFKAELDEVINALRSDKYGLLQKRSAMRGYAAQYPESHYQGSCCTEYGFRAETEKYAFLFRCNPLPGGHNFYCYCYVKEWLDHHIKEAEKGIRFVDSGYKDLFCIADGEMISITDMLGEKTEYICRYIDDYHMTVGAYVFSIWEFAEIMENKGFVYAPVKPELCKAEEKERKEKAEQILEYETLDVPPYYAFVATNIMPEIEDFLVKNGIVESTGLKKISDYYRYPLYKFNEEKLRELCPNGIAIYEQKNKLNRGHDKRGTGRSR